MKAAISITGMEAQRSPSFTLNLPHLKLPSGQILCVTGPNGSGKTTLLEILVGLLRPTKGLVTINGIPVDQNIRRIKATLGYIPDIEDWLVKELCAKEYFALLERVYREAGVGSDMSSRTKELASRLHFTTYLQPLGSLSHGNKKKVQIIAALMHEPMVIVADEIRNGLDPLAIIETEQLLLAEAKRGAAIIAATHDLWWAQRIGRHILLLLDGNVVAANKTSTLVKSFGSLEQFFMQTVNPSKP